MGHSRLDLQTVLEETLGSNYVYYQPPESVSLQYPCIIYNLDNMDTQFSDNTPHSVVRRYSVTVIDADPDSDLPDKIAQLPMCIFDRHYTADNLNHDIFIIYF